MHPQVAPRTNSLDAEWLVKLFQFCHARTMVIIWITDAVDSIKFLCPRRITIDRGCNVSITVLSIQFGAWKGKIHSR